MEHVVFECHKCNNLKMRQFENLKIGYGDNGKMWQGLYPAIAGHEQN